jgi:hypothetical protein
VLSAVQEANERERRRELRPDVVAVLVVLQPQTQPLDLRGPRRMAVVVERLVVLLRPPDTSFG